jgi:hypothetical protein
MIINLFEIPIFIGNIKSKEIKLKNQFFKSNWLSETKSSYDINETSIEKIEDESASYLLKTIVKLLEEKINYPFRITLQSVWENEYGKDDYQEPHIHPNSDFSFIIYKQGEEGKTVFFNPSRNFIEPFANIKNMFQKTFMPKCKEDQIVIFPSFLEHMVLKCSNIKTISGNLTFKKNKNEN